MRVHEKCPGAVTHTAHPGESRIGPREYTPSRTAGQAAMPRAVAKALVRAIRTGRVHLAGRLAETLARYSMEANR